MIKERNGVILHHGGAIEIDDQRNDHLAIRIIDNHGMSKTVVLTEAEGGHLAHELRLALKRIEQQQEQS